MAVFNPINRHTGRTNQPKQRICQIYPHRMLHPNNPRVTLRIRLDVERAKETKEADPEDEYDSVPNEGEGDARGEGDNVEESCEGCQGGGYFCVDLWTLVSI